MPYETAASLSEGAMKWRGSICTFESDGIALVNRLYAEKASNSRLIASTRVVRKVLTSFADAYPLIGVAEHTTENPDRQTSPVFREPQCYPACAHQGCVHGVGGQDPKT